MDVAEQALSALDILSRKHSKSILQAVSVLCGCGLFVGVSICCRVESMLRYFIWTSSL